MPALSRRALFWLLPLAVLVALGWKLLAGHAPGSARPASGLGAGEVQAACLDALARNLGAAASSADGPSPAWDGRRWTWQAAARVDGSPLRFACTVEADGRAIVRVLN